MSFSKVVKLTAVAAACFFLATQWILTGDMSSNLSETAQTELKPIIVADESYEHLLWPQLQSKLCPAGTPRISLGKTLFELAREELSPSDPPKKAKLNPKLIHVFYDDTHGGALVIDADDPSASLLYVRIWKCANSQIRQYLQNHFNQIPRKQKKIDIARQKMRDKKKRDAGTQNRSQKMQSRHSKHQNRRYLDSNINVTMNYTESNNLADTIGNHTYLELEGGDLVRFFKKRAFKGPFDDDSFFKFRSTVYDKPCVFTVIRDPISHFLSGYNEIEYRIITGKVKLKTKDPPPYTKIPHDGGGPRERRDPDTLRELRFEQFVRDLADENGAFYSHWVYKHAFPMARILHTLKRLKLLPTLYDTPRDWILPSVANLTERFPEFLAQHCPRFVPEGIPPLEIAGVHKSTKDPLGTYKAAKDVWEKGGAVARSLCHLHAFDYACFYGNETIPSGTSSLGAKDIPSVCKEVYASEKFRKAILG